MKALALQVGAITLLVGLGSCAAGIGVARVGGAGAIGVVGSLRDLGIIILALISLIMAAAWGSIYFGAAWATRRFGGKALAGPRWIYPKMLRLEQAVEGGTERLVVRPLAATSRATTTGTTLATRLLAGPAENRHVGRELRGWQTFSNRLRGRAAVPVEVQRAVAEGSADHDGDRERVHGG